MELLIQKIFFEFQKIIWTIWKKNDSEKSLFNMKKVCSKQKKVCSK